MGCGFIRRCGCRLRASQALFTRVLNALSNERGLFVLDFWAPAQNFGVPRTKGGDAHGPHSDVPLWHELRSEAENEGSRCKFPWCPPWAGDPLVSQWAGLLGVRPIILFVSESVHPSVHPASCSAIQCDVCCALGCWVEEVDP